MHRKQLLIFAALVLSLAAIAMSFRPTSASDPWKGDYFMNRTLTGAPATTRDDKVITFVWGYDPPVSGWPTHENYSVRWTKSDTFTATVYTFAALSDDGVRMFVDGKLIIDAWYDQEHVSWHMANVQMTAGTHKVVVEYYQHNGWAQIQAGFYPKNSAPATSGPSPTVGPSPTPTLTITPRPTRTPSLYGTVGSQSTPVQAPPTSLGATSVGSSGGETGGGPGTDTNIVIQYGLTKYFWWDGFPGPVNHANGQGGFYGYVKNRSVRPSVHAQWDMVVTASGYYDIYAYIPEEARATENATYYVFHGGQTSPGIIVDQAGHPDMWVLLGSFYLVADAIGAQYVFLDNATGEQNASHTVLLDAITLIYRP